MAQPVLASVRGFPRQGDGALDLDLRVGEVVRLVGRNGSGKTSLLRVLAGLDAPLQPAEVERTGTELVMQDPRDGLVGLTVTGEARMRRRALPGPLRDLMDRDVATLSSGEARRTALHIATASDRPLLLLDEPVEGLDPGGRALLQDLVTSWRERGTVVMVDHGDLEITPDRTVDLGRGGPGPLPPLPRAEGGVRLEAPGLSLGPGLHALTGPNGCGKTTWLRRLAGLDGDPARVDGRPGRTGRDLRLASAYAWETLWADRVGDLLCDTDTDAVMRLVPQDLLERHPLTLSGGEAKRVALARILGRSAPVYLLDEPEAHLDAEGRSALHGLLAARIRGGACILAATHDPGLIASAQEVIAMEAP